MPKKSKSKQFRPKKRCKQVKRLDGGRLADAIFRDHDYVVHDVNKSKNREFETEVQPNPAWEGTYNDTFVEHANNSCVSMESMSHLSTSVSNFGEQSFTFVDHTTSRPFFLSTMEVPIDQEQIVLSSDCDGHEVVVVTPSNLDCDAVDCDTGQFVGGSADETIVGSNEVNSNDSLLLLPPDQNQYNCNPPVMATMSLDVEQGGSEDITRMLSAMLPPNWVCMTFEDGVELCMMSANPKTVQRSLQVTHQGHVKIFVHGSQLLQNHPIWKKLPVIPSIETCKKSFIDGVFSMLSCVRLWEICVGDNNISHEYYWKKSRNCVIDENTFKELRYVRCGRSSTCAWLVTQPSLRCSSCDRLKKSFSQKLKRHCCSKKGTPKSKKPNKYLTTPEAKARSNRQSKINTNQRRIISRLREKISTILAKDSVSVDDELNRDLKSVLKENSHNLTEFQKLFVEQQVRASQVKAKCGMRWHPAMIRFALHLKLHSSAAYDVVQRYIQLPSSRTLFDYSNFDKSVDGVSFKTIHEMGDRLSAMKDYQAYHVLYFDEMTISKNLVYKKHTGEMVGYCNLSSAEQEIMEMEQILSSVEQVPSIDQTPPVASKMLTFMCNGVSSGMCEEVASFAVSNLNKESLFEKFWLVVENLELSGVKVVAAVCDGASVNRSFINMHVPLTETESGIVYDTKNFFAPDRILYFFSDPPHLLKTLRNCFASPVRQLDNNGCISWRYVVRLYKDNENDVLRDVYKLNAQAVYLNSYTRMKVSYAAQVLSASVANALQLRKYEGSQTTIEFIRRVNNFFDILNGNWSGEAIRKKNPLLAKYTSCNDPRFAELEEFLIYLQSWKHYVDGLHISKEEKAKKLLSQQTLVGIEITIRSFIDATRFLLKEGTHFIMARVFNQDYLEHYFSRQRAKCGGSTNPNAQVFHNNRNTFKVIGKVGVHTKKSNVKVLLPSIDMNATPMPKRKSCSRSLPFQ